VSRILEARYYVDTSAYLNVVLGEAGSAELVTELHAGRLLSSVLLALEAERTLVNLSRRGRLTPEQLQEALSRLRDDMRAYELRDLTFDLCISRVMPIVSTPRSGDLAHLRTALWFHERHALTRFVSVDVGQNQAARELGLPV
jgi:PIN domain nuclease of toxin-antitoxin system